MRALVPSAAILLILIAPCLPSCAAVLAQTGTEPSGLTPNQQQALKQGTALFMITLIALLLMVVAVVIVTITLRRRVNANARRRQAAPTDSESLWWRTGGPNPFEDEKKKK
jgi:heme/copper-type cytochrome/quinol oxidase subunit 2